MFLLVPVSFSIKKIKEPESVLPKPALPYESSSDDDEKNEKDDNPLNEEEKPKPIPINETPQICTKEKNTIIVKESAPAPAPIKPLSQIPIKEIHHKKCDNIPPPIIVQEISLSDFLAAQTAQMPIMIPVPKPEIITVFPPVKNIPTPNKLDSTNAKSSVSHRKLDIKKDIQRRVQELSSPSSSDSENKNNSVKKYKKSRSKTPQKEKIDSKKIEEEPIPVTADCIDLTDELYNLDNANGKGDN